MTDGLVRAVVRDGNTIYIGGRFTLVGPFTGTGVALDGASGQRVQPFPKVSGFLDCSIADGSGGWYIGGSFSEVEGLPRSNLAHILADGSVADWSPNANGYVAALAMSGDTIYVGGTFTSVGGQPRYMVAALDATTGLATDWNPGPTGGAYPCVAALVVSGSVVYAGGHFTSIGGQLRNNLAALDVESGYATEWNPDAWEASYPYIRDLAVNGNTVYAAGDFTGIGGQLRNNIAALDATTGEATAWNPNAAGTVLSLVVSGSVVYASGLFTSIGGQPRNTVAALDVATGLATPWNPDPTGGFYPNVDALAVSGSVIYVGGRFTSIGGLPRNNIAALDATTGLATAWDPNANDYVSTLAVGGGAVYAGGSFTSVNGQARSCIAALDASSGEVTSWNPQAWSHIEIRTPAVHALAVSGSTVYAGGVFYQIGGQGRLHIAALDATTGLATPWNPVADDSVCTLVVSGNTVYAGGGFHYFGEVSRAHIGALDAATGSPTNWNPGANNVVRALAVSGGTIYAGGYFTSIGGQLRNYIAAVDATTGSATAWNPNAYDPDYPQIGALAVAPGAVYAGGQFTSIGGQLRNNIAALDAATGIATGWDPNASGSVFPHVAALVVSGGTVYAGGQFTSIGGQLRDNLAALDATTGNAVSWNSGADNCVAALEMSGTTLYVGGWFRTIAGQLRPHLAALTSASVEVPSPTATRGVAFLQTAPNPARTRALIRFTLPQASAVSVAVFDIHGRRVATLLDRAMRPAGTNDVPVCMEGWPAGCYVCRLEAGGARLTRRFVVLK